MYNWTYNDETLSDWNLTVDQVKLSVFFTFQNDLQKQNWDQQDTKLTWLIGATRKQNMQRLFLDQQ